ncbi:MAG: 3,4-dihydroxy-9,10-secoandrosta-1,3,5(10)-triene-9,17-dione 4,5-dioxygenase [Bermanella sp.]
MNIRALGYVIIETTDLPRWQHFATEVLGLAAVEGPEGSLYLKMDERHHRYWIRPGRQDRLRASGWECRDQADYKAALDSLTAAGIEVQVGGKMDAAQRKVQAYSHCTDPSGNVVELFWGPISDFERFVSPIGVSGFVTGDMGLGHIVLPAKQFEASSAFWQEALGMSLSDFINYDMGAGQPPVRIQFMHCNNPRQHSVALVEMDSGFGCDHLLLETTSIDEVGRALYRCEDNDIPLQVSLGRHINDDMISFYMYSPTGFSIEYGAGGKRIEDWNEHQVTEATRGSHWGHRFVQGFRKVEQN